MWDSAAVGPLVTALICTAGYSIRLLRARLELRSVLKKARIAEEGRVGRIEALGEGGFLLEHETAAEHVVVCWQGKRGGGRVDGMGQAAESQKQAAKWAEVGNSYEQDKPYIIRFLLRQGATFDEAQDASHTAFLECGT